MGIEQIIDSNGKSHMVYDKIVGKKDELMGDKVKDYEILQVLGKGSYGFVAKVKSRINHKIYAMKQIDFSKIEEEKEFELCQNEMVVLKNLNHPLITKYYKSIKDGDCLYILMEFMDNGDLNGLISAHKTLGEPIEEEKLWNIFIQAMSSLVYIHSLNLVHRDIKPQNLFLNNEGMVKLGDFGVSSVLKDKLIKTMIKNKNQNNLGKIAEGTIVGTKPYMSPEMIKHSEYTLNTDVYSMGCTFFLAMFWQLPRVLAFDICALLGSFDDNNILQLADIPIKFNKNVYSKELVDIVNKMIEKNNNQRPDSKTVLNMLIEGFNRKFLKKSSISSIISCLYAYQNFTQYIQKPNIQNFIKNNIKTKPVTNAYLNCINSISSNNLNDWNNSLYHLKMLLLNDNIKYQENVEINPRYILNYILLKIHYELNERKNICVNPYKSVFSSDNLDIKQKMDFDLSNKTISLNNFISKYISNNKSAIVDFFCGFMKKKSMCSDNNCQTNTYIFNPFYYVTFNLNIIQEEIKDNSINIYNCFKYQNDIIIKMHKYYCRKCQKVKSHFQRKQFYTLPNCLIICFDRGDDCQNKTKILYDENLNLNDCCENTTQNNSYTLVGKVIRLNHNKEHYISIYYDFKYQSWIKRDDEKMTKIKSSFDNNEGCDVILFYANLINLNQKMNENMVYNKSQSSKIIYNKTNQCFSPMNIDK